MQVTDDPNDELSALRAENERLARLLDAHGIEWRTSPPAPQPTPAPSGLTTDQKIALFRRLFRGRLDVAAAGLASRLHGRSHSSGIGPARWTLT